MMLWKTNEGSEFIEYDEDVLKDRSEESGEGGLGFQPDERWLGPYASFPPGNVGSGKTKVFSHAE